MPFAPTRQPSPDFFPVARNARLNTLAGIALGPKLNQARAEVRHQLAYYRRAQANRRRGWVGPHILSADVARDRVRSAIASLRIVEARVLAEGAR